MNARLGFPLCIGSIESQVMSVKMYLELEFYAPEFNHQNERDELKLIFDFNIPHIHLKIG